MADGWGEVSYWPAERIEAGRLDISHLAITYAC